MRPLFHRTRRACAALLLSCLGLVPPGLRAGTFEFKTNDVIAFVGGANLVALAQDGTLETALTQAHPHHRLRFRDLAWEGDTVFAQPREVNYPSLSHQLNRVEATVVVLHFGQTESLAGEAKRVDFLQAYDQLLSDFSRPQRRLILVIPPPFEKGGGPLAVEVTARNASLREYARGIRSLAEKHGAAVVDLFGSRTAASPAPLTADGWQWTAAGQHQIAATFAQQLGWREAGFRLADSTRPGNPNAEIRRAVAAKNRLWFRASRPTNWAFLAGDRTDQLFSRDPRDRNVRAFVEEMKQYDPLLTAAEQRIDELAAGSAEKEETR